MAQRYEKLSNLPCSSLFFAYSCRLSPLADDYLGGVDM